MSAIHPMCHVMTLCVAVPIWGVCCDLYTLTLKNEYEPANALATVTIKQQIIRYQCGAHDDPVRWRQVMVQLYQKL